MRVRLASFAVILALLGVFVAAPLQASAALTNGPYPVPKSPVYNSTGTQVGTFTGAISNLAFTSNANGTLLATGLLKGTVTRNSGLTQTVTQQFTNVVAVPSFGSTCDVLTLDIGRIHLDLLGLIVNVAPIHIDISGQTGTGNLLGNLVCALVRLLG